MYNINNNSLLYEYTMTHIIVYLVGYKIASAKQVKTIHAYKNVFIWLLYYTFDINVYLLITEKRVCLKVPLFPHDATAPIAPGPPHYPGFMITLRHTTLQSIGLLWDSDQPVAETST
jgi:hypothetical protein